MQYNVQQYGELQAIMREALAQTIEERAHRPGQRFAQLVQAKDTLQHAGQQQKNAAATMVRRPSRGPSNDDALRESIVSLYGMLGELHATLDADGGEGSSQRRSTSRHNFFLTLKDLIGPMPNDRTWCEEWPMIALAIDDLRKQKAGHRSLALKPTMSRSASRLNVEGNMHLQIESILQMKSEQLEVMAASPYGSWPRDEAETFVVLSSASLPIAQALHERSARFAASTHTICRQLYRRAKHQVGLLPPMLYCHLHGPASLSEDDHRWGDLLDADSTGFRGLTSMGLVTATDIPNNFAPEGFAIRLTEHGLRVFYNVHDPTPYKPIDSPVVGFESASPDEHGFHAAVMTAKHSGTFPPNTLFALKRIVPKEQGFVHEATGVHVRQQLLVVSATYLPPAELDDAAGAVEVGSKFAVPTLQYASREAYIRGLAFKAPSLTMAQEFDRDMRWNDWRGCEHSLRAEWAYCTGPASRADDCTPGVRDANNDGMTPDDFRARANAHIRARRAQWLGLQRSEADALLNIEETVAVRLFSGPSFQPINAFLRQIANLTGPHRTAITRHAELTFSATVTNLCSAIRKLAAATTPEEAAAPLYRGIRGELPRNFWFVDEHGMVSATDTAFMSTSGNRKTPIEYMCSGGNVLWEIHPSLESAEAFHRGADISMLSQFEHEEECLFPPFTMLTVMNPSQSAGSRWAQVRAVVEANTLAARSHTAEHWSEVAQKVLGRLTLYKPDEVRKRLSTCGTESGKTFIAVKVKPSFV